MKSRDRSWRPSLPTETISVGPLSLGALHRAIRTALGAPLSRPLLVRVHEASGGRPLYALELARALGHGGSRDAFPRGDVSDLLRRRVAVLPEQARRALLLLATATDTSLTALDAFLEGSAQAELEPALEAGLVRIAGASVQLGHPLLAEAVLADAGPENVAAAPRTLASGSRSVEERAVHLARAADGPDPSIASSLDAAVGSARARGAPTTAADLAQLAAKVTPPDEEEARLGRLLEAADAAFAAGDIARARTLFESVAAGQHALRHRALWRLGVLLDETVGPEAGVMPLYEALETEDDALASAVHRNIAQQLFYTGDLAAALEHADSAVHAAHRAGSVGELAHSLGVLAWV